MKKLLVISTLAVLVNPALACTICQDVADYGTSVNNSIAGAGNAIASTTQTIAQNYASTSNALMQSGDSIVAAITASSNTATLEITKSTEAQARLLEALKNSIEQMERTKLVAENNRKVEETYGEANIPRELCEDFSRAAGRAEAKEIAKVLLEDYKKRQIQERAKEDRTQVIDPFTAAAVNLSSSEFTEEEAKLAMEQASVIAGERSFPVSPDAIVSLSASGAGGSDSAVDVMSAWVRTSNASQEIASQISKKTVPAGNQDHADDEPISLYGDLWKAVELSADQDANIQDSSTSASALLRSISRRVSVSNRIKLEQLETQLSLARLNASQIGYLNEKALYKLKGQGAAARNNAVIKRTGNDS